MTQTRLVLQSLRHHRRAHLAVLFGMIVGTAVLCGALIVGDSVRGSLRDITLERLGAIDFALSSPNFFDATLADRLASTSGFDDAYEAVVPAVLVQASLEVPDSGAFSRGVNLIGADERFWDLQASGSGRAEFARPESGEGVWVNRALATN
jgi:putative ABC transport system permease protein